MDKIKDLFCYDLDFCVRTFPHSVFESAELPEHSIFDSTVVTTGRKRLRRVVGSKRGEDP